MHEFCSRNGVEVGCELCEMACWAVRALFCVNALHQQLVLTGLSGNYIPGVKHLIGTTCFTEVDLPAERGDWPVAPVVAVIDALRSAVRVGDAWIGHR